MAGSLSRRYRTDQRRWNMAAVTSLRDIGLVLASGLGERSGATTPVPAREVFGALFSCWTPDSFTMFNPLRLLLREAQVYPACPGLRWRQAALSDPAQRRLETGT